MTGKSPLRQRLQELRRKRARIRASNASESKRKVEDVLLSKEQAAQVRKQLRDEHRRNGADSIVNLSYTIEEDQKWHRRGNNDTRILYVASKANTDRNYAEKSIAVSGRVLYLNDLSDECLQETLHTGAKAEPAGKRKLAEAVQRGDLKRVDKKRGVS